MEKFDADRHDENPPLDATFMEGMRPSRRGRPKSESPKEEVKIRLDAATVAHLRSSGPGWQTRVNAALAYMVATGRL